jgi:hypothetical protein
MKTLFRLLSAWLFQPSESIFSRYRTRRLVKPVCSVPCASRLWVFALALPISLSWAMGAKPVSLKLRRNPVDCQNHKRPSETYAKNAAGPGVSLDPWTKPFLFAEHGRSYSYETGFFGPWLRRTALNGETTLGRCFECVLERFYYP